MANLTISVSEEVLKRARIRALGDNTSVNAVLNRYLEEYAREDELRRQRASALKSLLELADQSRAGRGGKTWTRDDLHEG
jgi:hypothetical protein